MSRRPEGLVIDGRKRGKGGIRGQVASRKSLGERASRGSGR